MGMLLKCEHADFGYENQDAVVDANLEVKTGDYICIVGENGSGKVPDEGDFRAFKTYIRENYGV